MRPMKFLILPTAAAALAAVWLLPNSSLNAQTQSPPSATEQSKTISDQKLDAAAAALQRVASLKDEYQQRITAAPAPERERIVEEANAALEKAVTEQGLSVEEYNSIIVLAQNDEAVRKKILDRLDQSKK